MCIVACCDPVPRDLALSKPPVPTLDAEPQPSPGEFPLEGSKAPQPWLLPTGGSGASKSVGCVPHDGASAGAAPHEPNETPTPLLTAGGKSIMSHSGALSAALCWPSSSAPRAKSTAGSPNVSALHAAPLFFFFSFFSFFLVAGSVFVSDATVSDGTVEELSKPAHGSPMAGPSVLSSSVPGILRLLRMLIGGVGGSALERSSASICAANSLANRSSSFMPPGAHAPPPPPDFQASTSLCTSSNSEAILAICSTTSKRSSARQASPVCCISVTSVRASPSSMSTVPNNSADFSISRIPRICLMWLRHASILRNASSTDPRLPPPRPRPLPPPPPRPFPLPAEPTLRELSAGLGLGDLLPPLRRPKSVPELPARGNADVDFELKSGMATRGAWRYRPSL
mmetsp:Transcript_17650/g.48492  ORF Transcript_17650/g.48492 Transcript_17650/m.48492 type:complete len:398 (-) Transcript_17650:58-1251(-)